MSEILASVGGIMALISLIAFFVGLLSLIISDNKKIPLKIILYSVIGFVVGFGTCAANFSLSGMH